MSRPGARTLDGGGLAGVWTRGGQGAAGVNPPANGQATNGSSYTGPQVAGGTDGIGTPGAAGATSTAGRPG